MRMAKITLIDGIVHKMNMDELDALTMHDGMSQAFNDKAIINVEFFEESDL